MRPGRPAGDWRHIVRFGRNVASYKFALGRALLELGARERLKCRLMISGGRGSDRAERDLVAL